MGDIPPRVTDRILLHLPEITGLFNELVATKGPIEFSSVWATKTRKWEDESGLLPTSIADVMATLTVCDKIMQENPQITFKQALWENFGMSPWQMVKTSWEIEWMALIIQKDIKGTVGFLEKLGFEVEDGKVARHKDMEYPDPHEWTALMKRGPSPQWLPKP